MQVVIKNLGPILVNDREQKMSLLKVVFPIYYYSIKMLWKDSAYFWNRKVTLKTQKLHNFGKRYDDNFRVIFDQWAKLHLVLDVKLFKKIVNFSKHHRWVKFCGGARIL